MRLGNIRTWFGDKLRPALSWFQIFDAPVLVHELRVRQRGIKPFAVMGVYLGILSAIALLYIGFGRQDFQNVSELGKTLFGVLSVAQLAMIVLIVPAYSASAVSSERERGTFDLLALTLLSSMGIVTQKLAAAIAQSLMLIIASVPVMAIVFLLGGVSPYEILMSYGLLVVTAILLGALGLLCSCCLRNSRTSALVTYLIMLSFYAGLPIGGAWFLSVANRGTDYAAGAFPWMFVMMFLFVGGVSSLLAYAPLCLVMHNRPTWRSRAFRMGVFGGVYALLLLLLSSPRAMDAAVASCYSQGLFLPMFVNPFVALVSYIDALTSGSSGWTTAYWMVGATIGFSLGTAYLFRHLASLRFAGLRNRG